MDQLISRRTWIRQFVLGSVTTLSGHRWAGTLLAEATSTGPGPGVIRLKCGQLPGMSVTGGSVQYRFNSGIKPFTLNRVSADRFVALDTVCTHQGCTVGRYKNHTVDFDGSTNPPTPIIELCMLCPCHGSRYDIEGRNTRPAEPTTPQEDIRRFESSYDAATDIVSIIIPDLPLHIRGISVQSGTPARVKLDFPVKAYSDYEIHFQPDLAAERNAVGFSLTADGPVDQTVISTFSDTDMSVYVETRGNSGFFSVALILTLRPL